MVPCQSIGVPLGFLLHHAEHFVAKWMRDVQLAATLLQCHVDQVLVLSLVLLLDYPRPPRMHQDIFTEVPGRQAEMDKRGAHDQGGGQLKEGEIIFVMRRTETIVNIQGLYGNDAVVVA